MTNKDQTAVTKKGINPIWFLIIGIVLLITPAAVYLVFLIPQLQEEYQILLASGGVVGTAGITASNYIPESAKFGTLYKTASRAFTLLAVVTLVQDFMPQIIGLVATVIVSYIIFKIFKELWKDGKRKRESKYLAEEIARATSKTAE